MQLGLLVAVLVCGISRTYQSNEEDVKNNFAVLNFDETNDDTRKLGINEEASKFSISRAKREIIKNNRDTKIVEPLALLRLKREEDENNNETKIIKETEERVLKKTNASETQVETCGGIFSQPQFIIETPKYPSNYQNNLNCLFIFKGLLCETNYTLQFLDFNIEDTLGCTADRLEVKDKDALCGIHEGVRSYIAKTGVLELNFVSNGDVSARGFRILVSRSACLKSQSKDEKPDTFGKPDNHPDLFGKPLQPKQPDLFGRPQPNQPDFPKRTFPNNTTNDVGDEEPRSGYLPPSINPPYPPYPPSGNKPNHYLPPSKNPNNYPSSYNPPSNNHNPPPYYPNFPPYPPSNHPTSSKQRACCASTYSSKRFLITSPGFPHSNNHPSVCTFTIYKANPRVCRMRIILRYFSIGEQDPACTKGYLQIDGKLLCGCRTGMRLLSPFDFTFGNTKVFRLKNPPLPSSTYTGFAIEIIQDECPERYLPSDFRIHPNFTQEVLSIDSTEFFEPIDLGFKPRVVKHVYFFDTPNFYDDSFDLTYTYNKPRDVEESTYVDTSDLSPSFPKLTPDNTQCALWGLNQYSELTNSVLWKTMPKCSELNVYPEMSKCKDYNFIKGYFQSPGYPYYYPKNLNICYRFSKQRGFCKIRLMMLDFQVDQSYDCGKDYLLINGNFRYCGQSLANTFTLFDMIGKNYEEIKFITDGQSSGRGFRGVYEQIPCEGDTHHPHHNHVHTTPPPKTTTNPTPELPCSRAVVERYFTVDIYDYGKDTCDFVVRKYKDDVCRLDISFTTFDLDCNTEYLLINDDKFCGKLSGKEMSFQFEKEEVEIKYKRFSLLSQGMGLKLHLVGRQVAENCIVKLPPVQRILNTSRRSGKQNGSNSTIVVLRKILKEVCGVVLDAKKLNTTKPLCETLADTNDKPLSNCSPISDKTYYVPYNKSDKLELKFQDAQQARDVEFKDITCDNKFIL